jgi:hypothetical protein
MAKHFLDGTDVGASFQEVGCKGVAKGVGGDLGGDAYLPNIMLHYMPYILTSE